MASHDRRSFLRRIGAIGGAGLAGSLAGCTGGGGGGGGGDGGGGGGSGGDGSIRVAAISVGHETDYWNVSHRNAIDALLEEQDDVEVRFRSQVAPSEAAEILAGFAEGGYDLIYGSSFDFQSQTLATSKDYPDVAFEHVAGSELGDNMGQNYSRFYEACYLAGYATGITLAENDVSDPLLGYVASFPIAPTLRRINSFANGAYQANSDVEMQVNFIGTWYDPPTERQGANALIDAGADVLYNGTNSGAIVSAATQADRWSVGMYASMANEAGDKYITSALPLWDEMYANSVDQVRDGSWSADLEWRGSRFGWVGLDDWGPMVPQAAKDGAAERQEQIANGELDPFHGTQYEGHHNDHEDPGMTDGDEFLLTQVGEFVRPIRGQVQSDN
jgi:basic membrane protein A